MFLSSGGSVLLILFPSERGCLLDICTVGVLVSSHLLQVHLYGVLHSLILFLEGPYTAVCGMSACYRQEDGGETRRDQRVGSIPDVCKAKRCVFRSSIFVDGGCRKLKHGFSAQHRHKLGTPESATPGRRRLHRVHLK